MTTNRQSRTWPYDLAKAIVALALLGLMLYLRPDMGATIQRQLGLPVGTVTVLDAPSATGNGTTTLSGRTQSGATVDVFAGDARLGTTTAGADGTWSLPVALPPGNYQLRAQASDAAGAELGSPAVLEWTGQQQPVAPSGAQASADSTQSTGVDSEIGTGATTGATAEAGTAAIADAATADGTLAAPAQASVGAAKITGDMVDLSGAGLPDSAVEIVAVQAGAGELVLGKALVGPDGLWNVTVNISPGEYQVAVRTLDASGATLEQSAAVALSVPAAGESENETGSTATESTTEATAEGAAVEAPQMSAPVLSGDTAMVSGTAAVGAPVELVSNGRVLSKATADADGLWVMAAQLEPGTYALQVRSRDTAGAQVTASRVVSLTVPAVAAAGAVTATVSADQVAASAAEGAPAEPDGSVAGASASTTSPATGTALESDEPQIAAGNATALTGAGQPGALSNADGQAYIVLPGDSLRALAQEYLDDQERYAEIVAATNSMAAQDASFQQITDPDLLTIGQKIQIPAP
jgi:large repetitive protein